MERFGFDKRREYLPEYEQCTDSAKRRQLFLRLFNASVDQELRFGKEDMKKCIDCDLYTIFTQKIHSLLYVGSVPGISPVDPKKVQLDKYAIGRVDKFLKANPLKMQPQPFSTSFDRSGSFDSAVRLISYFSGTEPAMMINSDQLFKGFVQKNIEQIKANRLVRGDEDSIDLLPRSSRGIKIYPYWHHLSKKAPLVEKHLKRAVACINGGDFKQVYLVYPKNKDFNKHIEVKVRELDSCSDYGIKLIPYSLKSII